MDDSLLPVTSLRENLNQAYLDFSYFRTTEPKLTPALRKCHSQTYDTPFGRAKHVNHKPKFGVKSMKRKKEKAASLSQLTAFLLFYNLLHAGFFHQPSLNNGNSLFITFPADFL